MKRSRFLQNLALSTLIIFFVSQSNAVASDNNKARSIEKHVAHLLSGSGQWRAPNPEYEPGSSHAREYGMNYIWGPHKKFVEAEIVSIYENGNVEKNWSLFITYNPVTDTAYIDQTGSQGVYFRGEMDRTDSGLHTETGLIYLPNGNVKSVRDEGKILNRDTRISRVFERDAHGGWEQVREWTWTQIE